MNRAIRISPLLQLHSLVWLLALTGILGRWIEMNAFSIVVWRTGIAALTLFLWLSWKKPSLLLWRAGDRNGLKTAVLAGIIAGLHWLCFFGAVILGNVSVAVAGLATTSFFTALVEPAIARTKVRRSDLMMGLLTLAGVAVMIGWEWGKSDGLLLGILAAILAAIFPVLNCRVIRSGAPMLSVLFYEMMAACLTALLILTILPTVTLDFPSHRDWWPLLVLAIFCTVIGHGWHIELLKKFDAFTSNLVMSLEPIYGAIMGAVIFAEHEQLTGGFYFGMLLVVFANVWHEKQRRRQFSNREGSEK